MGHLDAPLAGRPRQRRDAEGLRPVSEPGVLSGKTALVTGGTGALGSAVVRVLLDAGARVSVPYRREGEFGSLTESVPTAQRERLSGGPLDLTDESAVSAYVRTASQE